MDHVREFLGVPVVGEVDESRATVVTGMRFTTVMSRGSRLRQVRMRSPACGRRCPGTTISISSRLPPDDPHQRRRAPSRQRGALAAREHAGHPLALARELRMPVRVHPAVLRIQPPRAHPLRDRRACAAELRGPDRAVLAGGDEGCLTFVRPVRGFVRHPRRLAEWVNGSTRTRAKTRAEPSRNTLARMRIIVLGRGTCGAGDRGRALRGARGHGDRHRRRPAAGARRPLRRADRRGQRDDEAGDRRGGHPGVQPVHREHLARGGEPRLAR